MIYQDLVSALATESPSLYFIIPPSSLYAFILYNVNGSYYNIK